MKGLALTSAVAVFTKYPHRGQVKTRLAATIGVEQACSLHTKMTYHALNQAMWLQMKGIADCLIFFHGASEELTRDWIKKGIEKHPFNEPLMFIEQQGDDLGARMYCAFEHMFGMGYEKMLLIGTDCPGITTSILNEALIALSHKDVVFGPAQDGGYYLIGMKTPWPVLFDGIPWSREDTLEQTLRRCRDYRISYTLLSTLCDIDREDDLPMLTRCRHEIECYYSSSQ